MSSDDFHYDPDTCEACGEVISPEGVLTADDVWLCRECFAELSEEFYDDNEDDTMKDGYA